MHLEDIGMHWGAKIPACTTVFRIRIGSEFNQVRGCRRAKNNPQNRKKLRNFMFAG
jgi:hypothetical protein